jgi:hypothetical protein
MITINENFRKSLLVNMNASHFICFITCWRYPAVICVTRMTWDINWLYLALLGGVNAKAICETGTAKKHGISENSTTCVTTSRSDDSHFLKVRCDGLWTFWILSLALILTNTFNLPEILWTNGNLILQRARLGPAWAILGWLVFSISLILAIANANTSANCYSAIGCYW